MKSHLVFLFLLLSTFALPVQATNFDWSTYEAVLKRVVNPTSGLVDYSQVKVAMPDLKKTAEHLAAPGELLTLTKEELMAHGTNAYNLFILIEVAKRYPLKSVKDVEGFFDLQAVMFLGQRYSFNTFEKTIRDQVRDPRLHFILNCASLGCPVLRPMAYRPESIEREITEQLKVFFADRRHAQGDQSAKELRLNKIFDWYSLEFIEQGSAELKKYPQLKRKEAAALVFARKFGEMGLPDTFWMDPAVKVSFIEYDWALNSTSVLN